ncbi:MAG: 7-carboxy-7-deazaguanine synthase QueE [Armatimonadota bacterium]|nr:7-carboxy-7-deazaguanine synthase QueE [Armatimonadota bacterium]
MPKTNSAFISEVFSSIQGEGLYVGVRQVFVRFAGCNLACSYCDTPASRSLKPELCAIQDRIGEQVFRRVRNPLDVDAVASTVARLEDEAPGHHSVSLTGGEPLMQATFLSKLCPELQKLGMRTYLESNGTLVDALAELLPHLHIVAMDFKLESATGVAPDTELHREFLSAAVAAEKGVFVKVVVSASTPEEEIEEAAAVMALAGRRIPLVIQPLTAVCEDAEPPSAEQLMQLQIAASRLLEDVRVIPQCHKLAGLI